MKTLLNLLKESQHLDYRRLNIGEEDLDDTTMTPDEKRAFVEAVASYRKIGEAIYHNGNLMEAYENIKKIVETAEKLTLKETGDWFDKVTVNRHMKSMNESFKIFSSTIKEVATLQQRLESSYDEIGEVLGKYYEIKEGNEFGAERAKAIASGDDTFNVGGKSFKVTDVDAQDKKNAEEFVGENMSNMKLGSFLKNKKSVNEVKVIVHNEKTGEKHEVLSGKGKGDLLIAMKALQSAAPSHMKYSIKESLNDVEIEEGNEFGAERARAIAAGKDSFTVDGKTYKVTDVDPSDKKNAEEFANESMKLSTLLKKKSVNEAAARLSDLLKQVASGSTSRIGSTKVDKKTAEKLLKIYNSGDVKMQNKFDGMSIDKVTSAFKPFMENKKLTNEVAPEGWEGTVKAMKDEPDIDNPWALAWWMKGKGYQSHKK